jgi:hypothetical protein
MFRKASLTVLVAMFLGGAMALAKAPAAAPPGTTGMCKDGSYTSAASKSGACSGHDGVKKWYGAAAEASTTAPAASTSEKGASSSKTKSKSKSAAETPAVDSTAAPASTSSEKGTSSGKSKKKTEPAAAAAAAPAAAATGMCKDGTSTSAVSKSGACSGHGGVKEWYGAAGSTAAPAPMSKAAPAAPAAPAAVPAKAGSYTPPATPAPGGGQGQVWVNKPSKVYHCPGDQWYGKTKDGAYMSEANAVAQGYRADHGKSCQ